MMPRTIPPSVSLMTEDDARERLAKSLRRLCADYGPTRLARNLGGIDEKTVRNARDETSTLSFHSAANLLAYDGEAFEPILNWFGRRSVPIDATCTSDVMVTTSAVVHDIAAARSPLSAGGVAETDDELLAQEVGLIAASVGINARLSQIAAIKRERALRGAA